MSTNSPINGLVALLELGRRARAAADLQQLGFVAVNDTRRVLDYRQAALWIGDRRGRVAALSGVPRADPSAPYVQWLARLMRSQRPASPQALTAADVGEPLAAEWHTWLPRTALLIPLGQNGLLLLARDRAWSAEDQAVALEVAELFAHAFAALRRGRRGPGLRPSRLVLAAVMLVGLVAGGLFPVQLSVLAPAEVGARDAFVVKSPLDGAIDSIAVRPSQPVRTGDLLFKLDATALRSDYEVTEKSYEAALAAYRQAAQLAVTDDKAKTEVARFRGEVEAMAVALNFRAEQLARTQVTSPNDGVAVFGDAGALVGKAVALGEMVMTIADPDMVELVIELPAGDQIPVSPGAAVEFYPDAAPFSAYPARVQTVAYRARITDAGILAFRVVAELDGDTPSLGMVGSARVYAQEVPLAYAILRRPLATLRQWVGL